VTLPDEPADQVLLQSPKKGKLAATPKVDVLVSTGPREESYVMPYLIGLNEIEAGRRLELVGLHRKTNNLTAPQWPRGTVIDQVPLGGTRIAASSNVELTVAN